MILQVGGEIRIVTELEAFNAMRFQSVGVPDALRAGRTEAHNASHVRVDQRVALFGICLVVLATTASTISVLIRGVRLAGVRPAEDLRYDHHVPNLSQKLIEKLSGKLFFLRSARG